MWPGFLWYILLKKMTRIGLSKLFRSFHGLSSTFVYLGEELPKIQKTGKLSRNTEIKKNPVLLPTHPVLIYSILWILRNARAHILNPFFLFYMFINAILTEFLIFFGHWNCQWCFQSLDWDKSQMMGLNLSLWEL